MDAIWHACWEDQRDALSAERMRDRNAPPLLIGDVDAAVGSWLEGIGLDGWRDSDGSRPLFGLGDKTPGGRGLTLAEGLSLFGELARTSGRSVVPEGATIVVEDPDGGDGWIG